MEAFDSEIESLQSTVKRKQKPPARLAHLEESVTRHKTHIGRLEQIIRLLDNDALQPDDVSRVVLEEIPEYIENNQEDCDAYEVRGWYAVWLVCTWMHSFSPYSAAMTLLCILPSLQFTLVVHFQCSLSAHCTQSRF